MIIQPRPFNLRKFITVMSVLLIALYVYYQREPPLQFWKLSGSTMGTTYSVKLLENKLGSAGVALLKQEIDDLLVDVNRQMSTYIPESEINAFNASTSTTPFTVSAGFASVVKRSIELCRDTTGAFNPTLDRLINAWGFGPEGPRYQPDFVEVTEDLSFVGCDMVAYVDPRSIRKAEPEVTINLNAIAKGWAVDQVAALIESKSVTNYFVEIGGEVFARGISEKIRSWRVGIDRPAEGSAPGEAFDLVVELDGRAIATSGDYRNFAVGADGVKFNHILDPRSGSPATTPLASVSVLAPDCATADAIATALFVMGTEEGLAWVEAQPGIEAAFIEHTPDQGYTSAFSSGFVVLTP
jgi:FAD:protein FMN transferase